MTARHTPDEWEYSGNTEVIGIRRVQTLEPICSIRPANYAHAALIAAAPKMLTELENWLRLFVEDDSEIGTRVKATKAIIRKARGE